MATAIQPNCPVVLLDSTDQYQNFQQLLTNKILARFVAKNLCRNYVSGLDQNIVRELHLFIPNGEHTLVDNGDVTLWTNYYIYCLNDQVKGEMERQYPNLHRVKVLLDQCLGRRLVAVAYLILIEQADSARDPEERWELLNIARECAEYLADEAREKYLDKIGVEPEETYDFK